MLDRVKLKIADIEEGFVDSTFEETYMRLIGSDFSFNYENFKGRYIARESCVLLEGSLHKFYKRGENFSDFTHGEVKLALTMIARKFGKELKDIQVQYVEVGVNLILPSKPSSYFNCFKTLGRNSFIYMTPLSGTSTLNGRRCKSSLTDFKVYNKTADARSKAKRKIVIPDNILRIEIVLTANYLRRNKILFNAEQLKNARIFKRYVRELTRCFNDSVKLNVYTSDDLKGLSQKEIKEYYFMTSDMYDSYIACLKHSGRSLKNEKARCKKIESKVATLEITNNYVDQLTDAFRNKREELMD